MTAIGYPIGTPNRGANRGGTNPPTRPAPTRSQLATAGLVFGSLVATSSKPKSVTREDWTWR